MANTLKKRFKQWLPVALLFSLLVLSLTLLNTATLSPEMAERYGEWQLYLNAAALLTLSIIILFHVIRVFYQWRTQQAGSRFTIRLMTGFLVLTLLPALIVSLFSMNFIGKRIDRWFDSSGPLEKGLGDAEELAQMYLSVMNRQHLVELHRLGAILKRPLTRADMVEQLDQFRYEMGAQEVLLLNSNQRLEAMSVADTGTIIPHFPAGELFRAMSLPGRDEYDHVEPLGDNRLFSRVALKLRYGAEQELGILTALFPVSDKEWKLTESVHDAIRQFKSLNYQRELLTDAFRLTLLLVMVVTVLFALSAAFMFSRRLTMPVRTLVEGTLAVAAGDLDKKLPVSNRDDFSLLARSFNTMTQRLSEARQEREQARRQLQQEHDYLHVVLEHLSSGVMTLDGGGIIRRMNTAAGDMLQLSSVECVGYDFNKVCAQTPHLQPFKAAIERHVNAERPQLDWQEEITLHTQDGRLLLVCRGASLPKDGSNQQGYVLVFDDVTDLIQAEHDAAWGEVARRLAHEIKNPLTPIQLSAERLNRKLDAELSPESSAFLKRMTHTIIQQVDNLKNMVNAFSQYARAPNLNLQQTDLNALVQEVTELYRMNEGQVQIRLQLDEHLPTLRLDVHRMRQLLVNLIKNALEALEDKRSGGIITLSTQLQPHASQPQAILNVQDNGPGIPLDLLPRLFEPYVTSKHKGTGLGLAIVKKIVEEHSGHLSARNLEPEGAMISIRFPLDVHKPKEQGQ